MTRDWNKLAENIHPQKTKNLNRNKHVICLTFRLIYPSQGTFLFFCEIF